MFANDLSRYDERTRHAIRDARQAEDELDGLVAKLDLKPTTTVTQRADTAAAAATSGQPTWQDWTTERLPAADHSRCCS
jgi:hypothetical protein